MKNTRSKHPLYLNATRWVFIAILGFIVSVAVYITVESARVKPVSEKYEVARNIKGRKDSNLRIEVYCAYASPACVSVYTEIMPQLEQDFGDRIEFSYRHFPMSSIHIGDMDAAIAAEAAGLQGKFFDMSNKLYGVKMNGMGLKKIQENRYS